MFFGHLEGIVMDDHEAVKLIGPSGTMHSKIVLSIYNNEGLIWHREDVMRLRRSYRMTGGLIGSLPGKARQNVQLSLPLRLLPEEVTILIEKDAVELVDGFSLPELPNAETVEDFKAFRKRNFDEQKSFCSRDKMKQIEDKLDDIVEGIARKRRKKDSSAGCQGRFKMDEHELQALEKEVRERAKTASLQEKHSLIQIPTVSCRPIKSRPVTWSYPSDCLRMQVFRKLWSIGYWLTPGGKFGCDFLVYPGDPCRFHSTYMVVCVESDRRLLAKDVSLVARLGSSVKKTVLLALLRNALPLLRQQQRDATCGEAQLMHHRRSSEESAGPEDATSMTSSLSSSSLKRSHEQLLSPQFEDDPIEGTSGMTSAENDVIFVSLDWTPRTLQRDAPNFSWCQEFDFPTMDSDDDT